MSKQESVRADEGRKQPPGGLIILGSESFSGKTTVMSGLCAALQDEGHEVRAMKPICIGSRTAVEAELSFIARVTGQPVNYKVNLLDAPGKLSQKEWNEAISSCRTGPGLTLLELPGSGATPLTWLPDGKQFWRDSADFAGDLGWPCLLVTRYGSKTVEQLLLNCESLILRGVEVVGTLSVRTTPEPGSGLYPDNLELALGQRLGIPYLGSIPYSHSISVLDQSQGNLKKLVSTSLDLLPVLKRLQLPLLV